MLVRTRRALDHNRNSEMIPAIMMPASNRPSVSVVAGRMSAGYCDAPLEGRLSRLLNCTGVETDEPAEAPSASGVIIT